MERTVVIPKYAFFRGRVVPYGEAKVGVLNHTLNYGTGVFGGLRGYWNDSQEQMFVFRPQDHYRRLLQSARMLCFELPYTLEDLTNVTLELLRTEAYREDCYVRPLAFFADEVIGVRLHDMTRTSRSLRFHSASTSGKTMARMSRFRPGGGSTTTRSPRAGRSPEPMSTRRSSRPTRSGPASTKRSC
jgi:branched-chain amino acid aminotransferase